MKEHEWVELKEISITSDPKDATGWITNIDVMTDKEKEQE